MITLRDFEILVNTLEMSEKEKIEFKTIFSSLFDFYAFIKETKGLSDDGVEALLLLEFEKRKNKFNQAITSLGKDNAFLQDILQHNLERPSDRFAKCFVDVFEEIIDSFKYQNKTDLLKTVFALGKFKFKASIEQDLAEDSDMGMSQYQPTKDNG